MQRIQILKLRKNYSKNGTANVQLLDVFNNLVELDTRLCRLEKIDKPVETTNEQPKFTKEELKILFKSLYEHEKGFNNPDKETVQKIISKIHRLIV